MSLKHSEDYDTYDEHSVKEDRNHNIDVIQYKEDDDNPSCFERFTRGIRGLWATKLTEDVDDDKELYVKTTLRELIVYSIYLVVLTIVTFGMTDGLGYYYTNILTNLFTTTGFTGTSGTYATGSAIGDYWNFLIGPLMGGLYWNQWYNNIPVSNSEKNLIYYENRLIGVPRLRQVRVQNNSCMIPSSFQNMILQCYGSYSPSVEMTTPFGPANSSAWIYTSQSSLQNLPAVGTITTYGGGGYYIDLNQTQTDSLTTINYLFKNLWIDRQTRAIILDFTIYNANLNLFCVVKIVAEFPASGGMIPNYDFRTVKLIRYVTPMDYFVLACELIYLVFIIYYIVEEFLEIRRHRLQYFHCFWNCLDIVVIGLGITCISLNVYRTIAVQNILPGLLGNDSVYSNFGYISYIQLQFNYVFAFNLFFSWVKVFKYISFNQTMTQLSETIGRCSKDLMGFAVMFFIIFFAFAQLGYLLFGSLCQDYSSVSTAITSLFRVVLQDFNFNQLSQASPILGPIYFILYVFFVYFVLFNMFLAIVYDTYCDVKEDLDNEEGRFLMGDYFKQRANLMLEKLNLKRDKILDLQDAMGMADSNNDNLLDYDEWKSELRKRGYQDEEIETVFAKYDTNGDRVLDMYERQMMQDELENQKAALSNEITKKESEIPDTLVSMEEYNALSGKIDRMEDTIESLGSKLDTVLKNITNLEKKETKGRETMGHLLDSVTDNDNSNEDHLRRKMEKMVNDEIGKTNKEHLPTSRPKSSYRPRSDFEEKY